MGEQAELTGPDLGAGVDASTLAAGRQAARPREWRSRAPRARRRRLSRDRRDLHALRRTARRRRDRRRHRALSLASRVFQSAHRRSARAPALSPVACWTVERRGDKSRRDGQGRARSAVADVSGARRSRGGAAHRRDRRRRRRGKRRRGDAATLRLRRTRRHHRRRHRLAVRSPEPLEGLSRRQRAGRMDSAASRRILRRASHRDRARPRDAHRRDRRRRSRSRDATR